MGKVEHTGEGRHKAQTRVLAAALCACAFVAFTAAQAAHLQPGRLQQVICKAPAPASTYSWLWDAPDFAVTIFAAAPQPLADSAPLPLPAQLPAAPALLEFSQHVRPPPTA
jgi:hypothetical protein